MCAAQPNLRYCIKEFSNLYLYHETRKIVATNHDFGLLYSTWLLHILHMLQWEPFTVKYNLSFSSYFYRRRSSSWCQWYWSLRIAAVTLWLLHFSCQLIAAYMNGYSFSNQYEHMSLDILHLTVSFEVSSTFLSTSKIWGWDQLQ